MDSTETRGEWAAEMTCRTCGNSWVVHVVATNGQIDIMPDAHRECPSCGGTGALK